MNRYQDSEPTKEDQDENNFMPPPLVMFRQLNVAAQAIQDAQIAAIAAAQQEQPMPPELERLNTRQINSRKYNSKGKRSPRRSRGRKVTKSPVKSKAKKSPTKSKAKRSRR